MARTTYTEAQRKKALKVYKEDGIKRASEATGVPRKTISSWASRAGLAPVVSEARQRAIVRSKEEFEYDRLKLQNQLLTEAETALDAMSKPYSYTYVTKAGEQYEVTTMPTPADKAKLATEFGIVFDKLQLLSGAPTSNSIMQTPEIRVDLKELIRDQERKNEEIKLQLIAGAQS